MITTTIYLYLVLLVQAPETLVPPKQADFVGQEYYNAALSRYTTYGHWDS